MKLKKVVSSAVAFFMTVTGVFNTNTVFAEGVDDLSGGDVSLAEEVLPYKDTSLSFEERAADLVARMTLEEKAGQFVNQAPAIDRLGVKKYQFWKEGLHGVAREGKATSFPSSMAMSNTWDRELIFKAADITSTEARGKLNQPGSRGNGLSYWSPTINMARDPRWGRNEESYGEDPYLTAQYGVNFINGMQGDDEKYLKTIATLKHFIANNCESERQVGTSVMDEQTLRDYYGKAFQDIMEAANAASVMSSYNATTVTRNGDILYEYIPSPANPYILNDLLRRNWGFDGYVTGDCGAVNNLHSRPTFKRTLFPDVKLDSVPQSETLPFAIKNGNDMDCGSAMSAANFIEAVNNVHMSEDDLDIALYRAYLARMRTGEFDSASEVPYSFSGDSSVLETEEHVNVALEAARKSWVLLKNEDNILPIKSSVKNVAIVGNMAGEAYLGGYSGEPEKTVSPYQGLVNIFKEKNMDVKLNYLGNITDETPILNIRALNLVKADGSKVKVDLSKADKKEGVTLENGELKNVTRKAVVSVPSVDFAGITKVEAEVLTSEGSPSGIINIGYNNSTQNYSEIKFTSNSGADYTTVSADYTGAEGGYNKTADLYITLSVNSSFSVDGYKAELDEAEVIIAYAGTTTSDSNESNDRTSIALPEHQNHVLALTEAYPEKTIVVMQTAGQMDVSPFINNTKAVLWNCYNGQVQGTALAEILMGDVSPSGRLSTTWYDPKDLEVMKIDGIDQRDDEGIKWERNDYSIRQRSQKPENFPDGFADKFPGRTYQYYGGTPVYPFGYGLSYTNFEFKNLRLSKESADANDDFEVSVDVKNAGTVPSDEVVQLYVKAPGGDGVNLPLKQLKGFERVSLGAGEEKTVTIKVSVKDLHFYDEKTTGIYVPEGKYTIMVGEDSKKAENLIANINITGSLKKELKRVSVIPTGISLISTVNPDGSFAAAVKTVDPKLQAIMTDENFADFSWDDVSYKSSDEDVAVVENNVVRANKAEGTALITASVTIGGVTREVSFPVVSVIKNAITDAQRAEYKKVLEDAYKSYDSTKYSEKNWNIMTETYKAGVKAAETEIDFDILKKTVEDAVSKMKSIKQKPAAGVDIYEVTKFTNTLYNTVDIDVKYNGDEAEPSGSLIAAVYDANGNIVKATETALNDSGSYTINGEFSDNEKMEIHIWDSFNSMVPFSKKYEHTYKEQAKPSYVVYNFSDSKFNGYCGTSDNQVLEAIEGLNGFGKFGAQNRKYEYTHTKLDGTTEKINFTRGLKGGRGAVDNACLYFNPFPGYSKCKVTVVYYNEENDLDRGQRRVQYLGQLDDSGKLVTKVTGDADPSTFLAFSAEFDDLSKPIYTWGGGANKTVMGMIVEYEK